MSQEPLSRVLCSVVGRIGRIELNRPESMNALDMDMVTAMSQALRAWEHDDLITGVLVTGAGDRAFCAGGDIRASQDPESSFTSEDFFRTEYALNLRIAEYPKPYIAVMHGLVLGGGMGLSAHGSHRIVTPTSRLGMPEVGIGFIPDVGMTRVLANLDGEYGTHLALTGTLVGPADAIDLGLADYYLPSVQLTALTRSLQTSTPEQAISEHASRPSATESTVMGGWIDDCYSADDAEEIVGRLAAHSDVAARRAAQTILGRSPTAVKLTLRALREARQDSSLAQSLEREFRVAVRAFAGTEVAEGIRAQLIDRDRRPQWNPATLSQVGAEILDPYFAELNPPLGLRAGD